MAAQFDHVYIGGTARHLPGPAIDNVQMDDYIAPLNRTSARIKKRILEENGIRTRHYAIHPDGTPRLSAEGMAAAAARECLHTAGLTLEDIGMLATGSCAGDALLPGFATMVLGELAGPPMHTLTSQGICASGMAALEAAANAVELGQHANALVCAAEMPSRLFRKSRYSGCGYAADFDAHFLRWMLSDGAGALIISRRPHAHQGVRLRLKMLHQRSFSGDYPVCMQLGLRADRSRSHLDYPSWAQAEADGALLLRQDIRLLPHLFDVGIHEYVQLVQQGWFAPGHVDHFLCHYSSQKFAPVVDELMHKAGLAIPTERWYSNLSERGNTGSASIFIMLDEFLRTKTLQPGEKILCFIPESGRFTVAFALIEVEASDAAMTPACALARAPVPASQTDAEEAVPAPHNPHEAPHALQPLLGELARIWHDYRSRVWRTPVIHSLRAGDWTRASYVGWMQEWIPQVREGSLWMREAAASLSEGFAPLAALIGTHAGEEQNDFSILYEDYRNAGGRMAIDALRRNPGGEALNAYLHARAARPDPLGLLGAIYIIEGTGQRIIPALLPLIKTSLPDLPRDAFRFLDYHGENDEHHLLRWLHAVELAIENDSDSAHARDIIDTARQTAALYLMQFQHITPAQAVRS